MPTVWSQYKGHQAADLTKSQVIATHGKSRVDQELWWSRAVEQAHGRCVDLRKSGSTVALPCRIIKGSITALIAPPPLHWSSTRLWDALCGLRCHAAQAPQAAATGGPHAMAALLFLNSGLSTLPKASLKQRTGVAHLVCTACLTKWRIVSLRTSLGCSSNSNIPYISLFQFSHFHSNLI